MAGALVINFIPERPIILHRPQLDYPNDLTAERERLAAIKLRRTSPVPQHEKTIRKTQGPFIAF